MGRDFIGILLFRTFLFNLLSLLIRNNSKINNYYEVYTSYTNNKVELIQRPCSLKNSDTVQGIL